MKAILIVDIPDDFKFKGSYADITLFDGKNKMWKREEVEVKPMPQHKEINFDDCMEIHNLKVGYNHCLDEILGEDNK